MEATARPSHHGLAPKDRDLPPVQYPSIVRVLNIASAAQRVRAASARGKLACFATSRETASAAALVRVPRECRLHVEGHSSHVAPRSCAERERPLAGAVPVHSAGADRSQRGTARARQARMFRPPQDTASAVALERRSRENRLCAGGHSSHVAQRPCTEGDRPPVGAVPFH